MKLISRPPDTVGTSKAGRFVIARSDDCRCDVGWHDACYCAVSAPVDSRDGGLIATLAIHAPVVRMSTDQALSWIPDLRTAAAPLSDIVAVVRERERP